MSQIKRGKEQNVLTLKNRKQHGASVEILEELKPGNHGGGRLPGADHKRPVG